MKISVVIPAYNEEKHLPLILKALKNQKEKPNEIIVVDNNSTDKTPDIAKKFGCKVVKEKKQGLTFARNKGFETAKYEIIARTDADSIPPPDWIKNIKEHFKKYPDTQALTGPVIFYDLPFKTKAYSLFFLSLSKKISGCYYLIGPNMVITKKAWEKVKNDVCLDDKKVHEDIDLALHLCKKGIEIKVDENVFNYISGRRIKHKPWSFFIEYPIRWIKMLKEHKDK